MKPLIKAFVKSHAGLLSRIYYHVMNNKVRGKNGNIFVRKNVFLRGLRINFCGKNNEVIIGGEKPSALRALNLEIHGSNHRIVIEGGVSSKDLTIYCADGNCSVYIKENTEISGKTELAVMEGTKIEVGKDCLFSANITLRAGDSHSVIDSESGNRLNKSKDIFVGDHVWIGNTVIITKGSVIGSHSVIATGSVVTGKSYPDNCAIGGNPAKVIKENIDWLHHKI